MAKQVDGLRYHLIWSKASAQATLCCMATPFPLLKRGAEPPIFQHLSQMDSEDQYVYCYHLFHVQRNPLLKKSRLVELWEGARGPYLAHTLVQYFINLFRRRGSVIF